MNAAAATNARPKSRWRPAPLLPRTDARDGALIFVVAVLCFLACLTAMGVIAADRAARGWTGQLTGEATVIERPRGGETPDAAAARAAEALAGVRAVAEARALEKEKAYDLIKPWLGDVTDLEDLPVPRLVAVSLDRKTPATAASLDKALKAQGLDAVVDDHQIWIKDIRRAAGVVRASGAGIFLLIALAAAAVAAFGTRAGLAARRDVVEVLHLTGAEEAIHRPALPGPLRPVAARRPAGARCAAAARAAGLRIAGGGEADAGPAARLERPCRGAPLPPAGRPGRRHGRAGHRHEADPGDAVRTLAALLFIALIWAAGLFAFAARVQQSTPQAEPPAADGIVALTGANSNERIAAAVQLVGEGKGRRVLVSGGNRDVSREQLRTATGAVRRLYDCCVDLGFTAADTVGNARETAEWAKAMRYQRLTIVTSDYHMPRAMLELRAVLRPPGAMLQTYAVPTAALKTRQWWRSPGAARLMVVEYSKYLAILGREACWGWAPHRRQQAPQKA